MKTHFKIYVRNETDQWHPNIRRAAGHGIFRAYLFDALRPGYLNETTPSYQLWPLYTTPYSDDAANTVEFRLQYAEPPQPIYVYAWRLDRMPASNFHDCGKDDIPEELSYAVYLTRLVEFYAVNVPLRIPDGFTLPKLTYNFSPSHLFKPEFNHASWKITFRRGDKECFRKTRPRDPNVHDQGLEELEKWAIAHCTRHGLDAVEIHLS
ncbi:hypothetical protein PQR34_46345 [Paraburkholderia sediminicola]|uniref:hypothetical protein n=1 Tax=Paraburkholderia sediminicola TaxID=458836 RepID=UPI0038BD052A